MSTRVYVLTMMLAAGIAAGCATGHMAMRGSVVMKIDDTKAHVCLGRGEVAVHDRVRLYKNTCKQTSDGRRLACTRDVVAEGSVTELLDDHYSIVAFPAGTVFEEGNTVEKL